MRRTTMNSWHALGSILLVLVIYTIRFGIFSVIALVAIFGSLFILKALT